MVVYMYLHYVIIIFVYSIICCFVDYLILSRELLSFVNKIPEA